MAIGIGDYRESLRVLEEYRAMEASGYCRTYHNQRNTASGQVSPIGGGYTCPSCGQWVPWNTTHYCYGSYWINRNELGSIEERLDRIEKLLKELAGK